MNTPERTATEFASDDQLKALFTSGSDWLKSHDHYRRPGVQPIGQREGMPLYWPKTETESYQLTIPGARLAESLPLVRQRLKIDDSLVVTFKPACLVYIPTREPQPLRAELAFSIGKAPDSWIKKEDFLIYPTQVGWYSGTCAREYADEVMNPLVASNDPTEQQFIRIMGLVSHIESKMLEGKLESNKITAGTCTDLHAIISNFDGLVTA